MVESTKRTRVDGQADGGKGEVHGYLAHNYLARKRGLDGNHSVPAEDKIARGLGWPDTMTMLEHRAKVYDTRQVAAGSGHTSGR